jgi:hypothetical protein
MVQVDGITVTGTYPYVIACAHVWVWVCYMLCLMAHVYGRLWPSMAVYGRLWPSMAVYGSGERSPRHCVSWCEECWALNNILWPWPWPWCLPLFGVVNTHVIKRALHTPSYTHTNMQICKEGDVYVWQHQNTHNIRTYAHTRVYTCISGEEVYFFGITDFLHSYDAVQSSRAVISRLFNRGKTKSYVSLLRVHVHQCMCICVFCYKETFKSTMHVWTCVYVYICMHCIEMYARMRVCMCMAPRLHRYICMWLCIVYPMYVCGCGTHIHTQLTYLHSPARVHMHACMYKMRRKQATQVASDTSIPLPVCTCLYVVCMYISICMDIRTYGRIYATECKYVTSSISFRSPLWIHVCMNVCMYVCSCSKSKTSKPYKRLNINMHICMHIYINDFSTLSQSFSLFLTLVHVCMRQIYTHANIGLLMLSIALVDLYEYAYIKCVHREHSNAIVAACCITYILHVFQPCTLLHCFLVNHTHVYIHVFTYIDK